MTKLTEEEKLKRIASHRKRQIGAISLAAIRSQNPKTPEKSYSIMLGSDNLVYCTCPAWMFTPELIQNCKHIDTYKARVVYDNTPARKP